MAFFDTIDPNEAILVCIHCVEHPDELKYVYHSSDGVISCVCERDHVAPHDYRWMHAEHIHKALPRTQNLLDLPRNYVAAYFEDYEKKWVTDTLLDPEDLVDGA